MLRGATFANYVREFRELETGYLTDNESLFQNVHSTVALTVAFWAEPKGELHTRLRLQGVRSTIEDVDIEWLISELVLGDNLS